ncbi:unnamed protein product [Cuscuta campestris]|uniref:Uncharacterized protein n=1 Tax=Cuscuta campestris TaxID=132261 RepID=A0A484LQX6_9ASTE|nr:unnamed protein product [Cuscuta campestris]
MRLGRNVIMSAAVVSSAPLVLPPLLAISAVGFVVWVPAGVVVAGYAAVEKLMATLLPLPQLPSSSSTPHDDDDGGGEKDFGEEGDEEGFATDENLTEGVGEYLKRDDGGGKDVIGEYGNLEEKGCEDDGGKWLEGECEEGKDVTYEYGNLEDKCYEDDGEKWLGGECEEGKDVTYEYGNLEEKGYEDDGEKCIQGEEGEAMEITTCVNLEEEYNVEDISKSLEEGGHAEDKYLNLEGAGECLEGGEQWGFEEDGDLVERGEEGYMDEVNDLLEKEDDEGGGQGDQKEIGIDEGLEEGYKGDDGDDGEYLEGKNEINNNAHSLKEGYMGEQNESEEEDLKNVSNPYASYGRDYSECSVEYTCTISAEEEIAGKQEGSLGSHAAERSNDVETKESADEPSTEVMAMISEEKIRVELERDLAAKGVNEEHCERVDGEGKVIDIDENVEEESYVEEYLESEHGEGEDVAIDEDLRKGCYVEEAREYLKGEDEENINENLEKKKGCVEKKGYEDEECEEEKDAINVYENLEKKGHENDGGRCIEGEQGDTKGIKTCLKLKAEYNVEDDRDVNLEEGYKEGVDKYLEGEQRGFEEIVPVDGDLMEGEGYMEGVDEGEGFEDKEYLEGGAQGDRKEIAIDEGLEEGYEGDGGEYLEEEQGGAAIDWNLEDGERSDDKNETNNARISKVEVEQESRCGIGESLIQKDEPNTNEEEDVEMDISVKDDVNAQASEESVAETEKQRSVGEDLKNDSAPLESGRKYVSDGTGSEPSSTDDYTCTLVSMEEGNVGEQEGSLGSHTLECSTSIIKTKESAEPSNEVMGTMSEEKIWEQVSAIRAILGYKDAKQRSTVDEIKALFVFIGVEPPSPFDDPSHLTDVYQKLKILMSIVGTK